MKKSQKHILAYSAILILYSVKIFCQSTNDKSICPLAKKLEGQNNFNGALTEWNKCLLQNPSSIEMLMGRGTCYLNLGQFENAKSDFQKITSIEPNNEDAILNTGWSILYGGKPEESLLFSKNRYNKQPQMNSMLVLMGSSNQALGNFSEAINNFTEYLKKDSLNIFAMVTRADCYSASNQFIPAIADYSDAIKRSPENSNLYVARGVCKKSNNEQQNAMIDFNKAIQIDAKNGGAYLERGRLKFTLGDDRGAILDYDNAIKINPNDAMSLYFRSISKTRTNDLNGALSDINKCIAVEPQMADAYYTRGWIKIELKNIKGACADFSKAGELGYSEAYNAIKENCN
ncbi:MAG: tetratricopeptide repeat protein [Bacteroidota bacterium]|jgi:tetratricopeptide (TPR) repeat protein